MAKINGITIETVTSETPQYDSDITSYPVEGGDITDNVHNRPVGVSIEAVVSDATQGLEAERQGAGSPSAQVREKLISLRDSRQAFTYEGATGVYRSVVFESLSFPVDAATGNALRVSATLRVVEKKDLVRVAASANRREYRPSKRVEQHKLWLCPYKKATFLGIAGSVKPGPSAAANLKAGCREVRMSNGQWVFTDNGAPLTSQDVTEMRSQNFGVPASQLQAHSTSGAPAVAIPTAALPGPSGKATTYAPGAPAIKKMNNKLKWVPTGGRVH